MERAMGIEPTSEAWEASILPLYDARSAALNSTQNCDAGTSASLTKREEAVGRAALRIARRESAQCSASLEIRGEVVVPPMMRRSPGSSRTMTSPKLTRSHRQSFFGLIVNPIHSPLPPFPYE